MKTNWLAGVLLALAAFRGYAFVRHRELEDFLAALGFVLFAWGEYRRVGKELPGRKDHFGMVLYVAGAILIGVAAVMMLIPGG